MKERILITGSNGLLGQKIILQLIEEGEFDFLATSSGDNRLTTVDFNYETLDITNRNQVNCVFDQYQPTAVINTAAMTNVDQCEDDREGAKKLNVDAAQNLIAASQKHNSQLLHLSTDFVFDGEDGPYSEEDKPNPLSYYAETKNNADNLVMNSGLSWSVVRTMLVYGVVQDMSRSNVVL
ncbi:MAG: sugar nucleotide-binding protein, partial [Flavobacteriales bacterium]|nr:sugar nucleotide-binding protein [Flavobacteriales bacterium]